MRPYLRDSDPRIVATAAVALGEAATPADRAIAVETLERLASDGRESAAPARREAARAIARTTDPQFRQVLTPLMNDPDLSVAREAIRSARLLGDTDLLFVPVLVSLLRDRRLKNTARDVLVSYGEDVIPTLITFSTTSKRTLGCGDTSRARSPSSPRNHPRELLGCLGGDDGFIRYKAIKALERMKRESTAGRRREPRDPEPIQALLKKEVTRYYRYLGSYLRSLRQRRPVPGYAARAGARTEARPCDGSHLSPDGPFVRRERHPSGTMGHRARGRARSLEWRRVSRQHAIGRCAQVAAAFGRRSAPR